MGSAIYFVLLRGLAWTYTWVIQEEYTRDDLTFDWADRGSRRGHYPLEFVPFPFPLSPFSLLPAPIGPPLLSS